MKPHPSLFIAVLIISLLVTACSGVNPAIQSATATYDPGLTRVRIGVDPNLPPFESFDAQKGESVGFDIEVMKAVAAKAGFYVEFVQVNAGYLQMLDAVAQCQLDGAISAIPITDALKQKMNFSEPYYSIGQVLAVKKGNVKINGLQDLAGATISTQAGSPSELALDGLAGVQAKPSENYYLAFQQLINGDIDAVIADYPRALKYVNIKPNNLKIVGEQFDTVSYGIALCKNEPKMTKILSQINESLAALRADGTLEELAKTWLKDSLK